MKNRVLFIESYEKCIILGVLSGFSDWDCEFDGRRFFRRDDKFFKRYDLVVASNYASSISNLICCKCKTVGIKTLFFADGIYDLANSVRNPLLVRSNRVLYGFLPFDEFATISNVPLYCGSPNFRKYVPDRIIRCNGPMDSSKNEKKILITTANTAYFNDSERSRFIKLIRGIVCYLDQQEVYYSFRIFDESLLKEIAVGQHVSNVLISSFEECLESYSHVITTPSSIVLTSIYHGKATAQLIYRSEPPSISTAWNIPSVEVFIESFRTFIDKDDYLMKFQTESIKELDELSKPRHVVQAVLSTLGTESEVKTSISDFRKSEVERIMESSLNFNIEFFVRKFFEKKKFSKLSLVLKKFLKQ